MFIVLITSRTALQRVSSSPASNVYKRQVLGPGSVVTANDIKVTRDTTYQGQGNRYLVELVGQLAGKSVPGLGMSSEKLSFKFAATQAGSSRTDESQRVDIAHRGSGTFILSLNHEGQTYTTNALDLGAGEHLVQAALNRALGTVGSVTVTAPAEGSYLVSFGGALAGKNLAAMTVVTTSDPARFITTERQGQRGVGASYLIDLQAPTGTTAHHRNPRTGETGKQRSPTSRSSKHSTPGQGRHKIAPFCAALPAHEARPDVHRPWRAGL